MNLKKISMLSVLGILLMGCSKKNNDDTSSLTPLPAANGLPVTVTVNQNQPGYVIPATFQGLSYETGIMVKDSTFLNVNNMVLLQLIKNLGPGLLRVGGNSSDEIYWTGHARAINTGTDSLTTSDIDRLSAFAKATGWQVLFGLNLGGKNPAANVNEAAYVNNSFGRNLYAFQIGNEPDLFYHNGIRQATYRYADYQQEWNSNFSDIKNKLPGVSFAGPDVANNASWISSFADNERANVKLIDGHYYRSGPASNPAIDYHIILAPDPKLPVYLQALNTASQKNNLPYRISECNSIYDGGKTGVSDVFAAALWTLDFMWNVAGNNGTGVNFHGGSGGAYSPVAVQNGILTARPEYYGMLAFKYGSTGGTILPVTLSQTTANCSAYACKNPAGTSVTLINKDVNDISYTVQLSQNVSTVQVARLTAPSITAKTGITFAGNAVNSDGTFNAGTVTSFSVNHQNSFVVNVPAGSAAIVTAQ